MPRYVQGKSRQELPMANGRNKYQARESKARIREVQLESWDPCGVRDAPQAHDEYDAYIGRIYVI
jgi:hypothetical protein